MVLELYYDLLSQPSRAVYLLLKCSGTDFEPKLIDLFKGEHHTNPEFTKKGFTSVPSVADGDFFLTESVAILRYIAAKNNLADHWYPRADAKKQARTDEFLNWQHNGLRKHCCDVFLTLFMAKIGFGGDPIPLDAEKAKTARVAVTKSLNHIATYFLKDKKFINGDEISAADILGVMEILQLDTVLEDGLYTSIPKVKAWVERVKAKLNPHCEESLSKLKLFKDQYKKTK